MKIAFLFLVLSDVYHQKSWINFFAGHKKQASIYVHAKDSIDKNSYFKKYELSRKVPTTWLNTMNAQIELLKEALKDPHNKKFVFLSDSTIPLQSFDTVYKVLMSDPYSHFDFWPNPHPKRHFYPLPDDKLYKNSQWIVLNRKHAKLMVSDYTMIHIVAQAPYDNEHYPSTFLVSLNSHAKIVKKDSTFTLWPVQARHKSHPHVFEDLLKDQYFKELVRAITHKRMLFGRKFSKNCDLSPLKKYIPFIA